MKATVLCLLAYQTQNRRLHGGIISIKFLFKKTTSYIASRFSFVHVHVIIL